MVGSVKIDILRFVCAVGRHAPCLLAVLALFSPNAALARSRPDQVLVVYNKDWTQDLDGSEPGQDSEEVARYYVARRTDPSTGLKPYMLGLSSPDPANPVLNHVVLPEKSNDNWLGLDFRGKGDLKCTPWPLSSRGGALSVPFEMLVKGGGSQRYAYAFLSFAEIGPRPAVQLDVSVVSGGRTRQLADSSLSLPPDPALIVLPGPEGTSIIVDFMKLDFQGGRLSVKYKPQGKSQIVLEGDCRPRTQFGAWTETPFGGAPQKTNLPDESRVFPFLLSEPEILGILGRADITGIALPAEIRSELREETAVLTVSDNPDGERARPVFTGERPVGDANVTVYEIEGKQLVYSVDFSSVMTGTVWVSLRAEKKDGGEHAQQWQLYDIADFRPSATGPDGIRDDQVYLDAIENPIKRFLESTRTADGALLRDHILYIVPVHGLPLQVASLYGIERGTTSASVRGGNLGSGSALSQRLRMLYYDVTRVNWRPVLMVNGGGKGLVGIPNIAHGIKSCMAGPGYNPYFHPLTHNSDLRQHVWQSGKWDAVRRLDRPPFSSETRARMPQEKFLYGTGRIDGPSVAICRNQIDGAIYGERHVTPGMGPVYYGTYQEGPFAAQAVESLGFETKEIPERAERALMVFGVFGYGAGSYDEIEAERSGQGGLSIVWEKGFYPGSMGTAIRSFLGWDRERPPQPVGRLFEQLVRGGVTVTAGSAGGSHETNVSWWDSFVFNHLMFSGYEYGDATLRSMMYLDWTVSLVGDPLYAPDLSQTTPDAIPPSAAKREDIRLELVPAGADRFALEVEVTLGNPQVAASVKTPKQTDLNRAQAAISQMPLQPVEMAEIEVECVPRGSRERTLRGENTRYSCHPTVFVMGLEPQTAYDVFVTLKDPYGNAFESRAAFDPLRIETGAARQPRVLVDRRYDGSKPFGGLSLKLPGRQLDEQGEVHLHFEPTDALPVRIPQIRAATAILDAHSGFRIGGARMELKWDKQSVFENGQAYHLALRWRRRPVTREVYLVTPDGTEFLLNSANNLPWDPVDVIGEKLTVTGGGCPVSRVVVIDDAPAAPPEHRKPLRIPFDVKTFRRKNG